MTCLHVSEPGDPMRLLIITAVEEEARAIGSIENTVVIAGGIGRVNAAAATTEAILQQGPFDAVLSAGIAGSLPGADLAIGDTIVAEACVYAEEGLQTPEAFHDMAAMGFSLGDFEGNVVPVDGQLLERVLEQVPIGRIATVATCSGTDLQAETIARRTGAIAEAMEGAAVVHAARRLKIPSIEVRTISNTTGDRQQQTWDLKGALAALGEAIPRVTALLRTA